MVDRTFIRGEIRWLSVFLMGAGTLLVAATLFQISVRLSRPGSLATSFILGVGIGLPFAAVLVAGGYWLTTEPVPRAYDPHIAVGTIAGMVFFGVFLGIVAVSLFDSLLKQAGVIGLAASVGGGGGLLVSCLHVRSIDQEVTAERALVRAEEAEQRKELLEYLHGLLRHEVLNTATAISGHTNSASEITDDATVQDRLRVIRRQTDELTRVIDDVQLLLEAEEDRADLEPVNLTAVLHDEIHNLQDTRESVEIETRLSDEVYVRADDLLRRLFSNLLENAVVHNGGATPRVSVTATRSADTVAVRVEDNGPGFPDDALETIFEPKVETGATYGLGLAIVNRLADRYHGSVELTDTGPEGSVVTVTLPRADTTRTRSDPETAGPSR